MIVWIRTVLILAIGVVPFWLYKMSEVGSEFERRELVEQPYLSGLGEPQADLALVEMNRGVEAKARELREIDVKILETKGSILKLEENRQAFVSELESIQSQIQSVINGVKNRKE